jgi:5-methylcytosine-specific restriction protein B
MIGNDIRFSERIIQELKERYTELSNMGNELLSREQLANYQALFRRRFGPERLKNLDGEALLETMHSHGTKESMVYWLEFKDDEEFSSPKLGSIAGGSAHKFGLFRKQDTGQWVAGSPQKEQVLALEQAIQRARMHRDQLVWGAEYLERFSSDGNDADYARLQQEMERNAPAIQDSAWGHKYFSILYPEKLDDFHSPDYQRFHLLKLLQLPPQLQPPSQAKKRYLAAGRFVALAQSVAIPMNNLTTVLNIRDERNPYNYWRIGTTRRDDGHDFWPLMRDSNCVAIGWLETGDLTNVTNDTSGKETIKAKLLSQNPSMAPQVAGKAAQQLFYLRHTIAFKAKLVPGDLVLASNGASVLGIGRVTGQYSYEPASPFPHRRPVEWLSLEEWQQPDIEGLQTTVYRMRKDVNLLQAEKQIYGREPIISIPPSLQPPEEDNVPPLPSQPSPLAPLPDIPARIQAILERKGQVILYGPPGTGKTYWAEFAAHELAARANYRKPFDQLEGGQKEGILGTKEQANGTVRWCSFHPAYGYEDFLEGFRPQPIHGQMHFILRDGIFKTLCKDAQVRPDQKFYLIIDEINRGDIPRIFGELLTVLEKNKRGKPILLPLTGKLFSVPSNVYIIGTMNTADRSIALLDTALRRRFSFLELMPDISFLGNTVIDGIPLGPWLAALNKRIFEHVGRDARNLQLGHSYLMEGGHAIDNFATFVRIIQEDIFPLLEEYCYEDYTKLQSILGSNFVDSTKQQFRRELFDEVNKDQLITALLAIAPEITTSRQVAASEAQENALQEDEAIEEENNQGNGQ